MFFFSIGLANTRWRRNALTKRRGSVLLSFQKILTVLACGKCTIHWLYDVYCIHTSSSTATRSFSPNWIKLKELKDKTPMIVLLINRKNGRRMCWALLSLLVTFKGSWRLNVHCQQNLAIYYQILCTEFVSNIRTSTWRSQQWNKYVPVTFLPP